MAVVSHRSFFLLLILSLLKSSLSQFNYDITDLTDGPLGWGGSCNTGGLQSPIDIDWRESEPFHDERPFRFYGYDDKPDIVAYENGGYYLQISFKSGENGRGLPYVMEGGLPHRDKFQFYSINFHWGSSNRQGSEHTIDGKRYPLEARITHYNREYGLGYRYSAQYNAGNNNNMDNFAIFSILFEIQVHDNEALWPMLHGLRKVKYNGDTFESNSYHRFRLQDLMPRNVNRFWRYQGSETVPGCLETVLWTVFKETVGISWDQIKFFRHLRSTAESAAEQEYFVDNFRPIQPRNGRQVFNFDLDPYNRDCGHNGLWKQEKYIRWRESLEEFGFFGAIHHCLGSKDTDGTYVGLIPVGKLRHFRNRWPLSFDINNEEEQDHFCRSRMYRVNAIKSPDGVWREFPCGREALFHHYPEFDSNRGNVGDTLVWDSYQDRLIIQEEFRHYRALCYRENRRCHWCQGHDIGHECNDAGDCADRQCHCDEGFSGSYCQIAPLEPYAIATWGMGSDELAIHDFYQQTSCETSVVGNLNEASSDIKLVYAWDELRLCVMDSAGSCFRLNTVNSTWVETNGIMSTARFPLCTVIRHSGEDRFWMIAGGVDDVSPATSNPMYSFTQIMNQQGLWMEGPNLPEKLTWGCLVQISDCEVAAIGGLTGTFQVPSADSGTIYIYNFETNQWREGPTLDTALYTAACAKIKHHETHHETVVISCGLTNFITEVNEVQAWDLVTDEITTYPSADYPHFTCPTPGETPMMAERITDYQMVFAMLGSPATSQTLHLFDFENGYTTPENNDMFIGASTIVPSNINVECASAV